MRPAFSVTQSWHIWKNSLGLNSLIQNSVQEDHLPELYPIVPYKCTHLTHQKTPPENPPREIYLFRYQECHSFPMK